MKSATDPAIDALLLFSQFAWNRAGQSFVCDTSSDRHAAQRTPPEFWDLWRADKAALKPYFSISKDAGAWTVRAIVPRHLYEQICAEKGQLQEMPDEGAIAAPEIEGLPNWLLPHQVEGVSFACHWIMTDGCYLFANDTGQGKTFMAIAVATTLNRNVLAIVPKNTKTEWMRVGIRFGVHVEAVSWEKFRYGKNKYGSWIEKEDGNRKLKGFVVNEENFPKSKWLIVPDEIHRAKADGSANCKVIEAIARQNYWRLGLSATPAGDATESRALSAFLKLRRGRFSEWLQTLTKTNDYKAQKRPVHMKRLRHMIFTDWRKGHKLHKSPPGMPEIITECKRYPIPKSDAISKTYARCAQMLEDLERNDSKGGKINKSISEEFSDSHARDGVGDAKWHEQVAWLEDAREEAYEAEQPQIVQLRTMQLVEMHKVSLFVDLAQEYVADENSVCCFFQFRWPLYHVAHALKTKCIIDGAVSSADKTRNMDLFQANQEHIILLNMASGGEGISLHNVDRPDRTFRNRVSLISPGYSILKLRQSLGRIWRAGCMAGSVARQYLVFVDEPTEDKIASALERKGMALEAFTGDNLLAQLFDTQ